ncbi:DUF397 domain-containing protein [Streptomyces sp. NPDC050703]|uniref:DUF397 domain-containing protein n=1 Tax=Streptomyces sp. NPDC050703 TaxID=3157218 RepID=UPI0034419E90
MTTPTWQKSSYCAQGDSCVHVAISAEADRILLTESAAPRESILTATPDAFAALLSYTRQNPNDHG